VYAKTDSKILGDYNIFHLARDSRLAGRTTEGRIIQDLDNIQYQGDKYRMGDRGSVDADFKQESQEAYDLNQRVDCEHNSPDQSCWNDLYDTVVAKVNTGTDL
jgi:hypothetical protein